MDEANKIHLLSYELIPIVNDIEPETREVVMDHIATCELCQRLYLDANELDHKFPEKKDEPVDIKPLKKLVQFNKGIKLLLIMIRVAILTYAIFSGVTYTNIVPTPATYLFMQSIIYFFYVPASLFLLVFTFVFLNKRWLIYSIIIDVMIVFGISLM